MSIWQRKSVALLILVGSTASFAEMSIDGLPSGTEELGRANYTNCAACHGAEGQGGFAPTLVANVNLKNTEYVIAHILKGSPVMPAFKNQLSSDEIAALINHVRNSWGNRAEKISGADVVEVEKKLEEGSRSHRTGRSL